MEENKEVEILEIDGLEYVVLEEFDNKVYTVNVNDQEDIKVFKTIGDDLEELSDNDKKIALDDFYEKYKDLLEK